MRIPFPESSYQAVPTVQALGHVVGLPILSQRILRLESDEHPGRFGVTRDNDLLRLSFVEEAGLDRAPCCVQPP
jgi:hypothetical protein